MKHTHPTARGASLVEAVIAMAVIVTILAGIIGSYPLIFRMSLRTVDKAQAALLLEEGVEAVKVMRDNSWSANLTPLLASTTYYLSYNGTTWVSTPTVSLIDAYFERTFAIYDVFRDGSDDIVTNGSGTMDPKTKKLTVFVSWPEQKGTTTRTISTYITNLFDN